MHPGSRSKGATVFLEQMEFAGASNGLSAIGHGEPGENVFDVELDRVQADHQLIGDLLIGRASREQVQHFQFTRAKWVKVVSRTIARVANT
jgi:hypothetical protein